MKKKFTALLILICLVFSLCTTAVAAEEPVKIAIIDTGIATAAIDSKNILPGKNYVIPDGNTEDVIGHGTAIASIIVGSESAGIEGICPDAVLVPLVWKSRNAENKSVAGDVDVIVKAIYDAIDVYDCKIINLSAGTEDSDEDLQKAVEYAEEKGVLIVSVAGNDGNSVVYYPGGYDTVICVGSCDKDGTATAYFSNSNGCVDILAPGDNLITASIHGKKIRNTGTSFSAAYVTATAARMLEIDPSLTPSEIRTILRSSATDIGGTGYDKDSGWGILNTEAAVNYAKTGQLFRDVSASVSYSAAVKWAFENGVTDGTSKITFSPNATCTRSQVVTFLWRAAGEPQPEYTESVFSDVKESDYYYTAVSWAVEQGITNGTSATTFSPNVKCTEGQILTFLWRANGSPIVGNPGANPQYYTSALLWAQSLNLIDSKTFSVSAYSPRANIVSYLYAFNVNK